MNPRIPLPLAASLALTTAAACDGDVRPGAIQLTAHGEAFIEEGIPADAFADGWRVEFTKFLVVLSDITVGRGGPPELSEPTPRVVDVAHASNGAGHIIGGGDVPAGGYDDTGFVIGPSADAAMYGVNVSAADVAMMRADGLSIFVQGSAVKDTRTIELTWRFTTRTVYRDCESTARVDGGSATTQITIHGDHLFYDSLVSEAPDLRFDLIADADADGDGSVTADELTQVDITALPDYQVGNATDVADLWAYLEAQTKTLGHIDGEGHCATE